MDMSKVFEKISFDERGLVPAVVQDINSKKVLMLAYMNKESIQKTFEQGIVHYYSRSRQKLWKKGETSGNIQYLKGFYSDCDKDTILVMVDQVGVACHTGRYSCFFNELKKWEGEEMDIIGELYTLLEDRKANPKEGSYTNYLFEEGMDKILKKVGEESSEVIIGAKNKDKDELVYEISDLIYHLLVLMVNEKVTIEDIKKELDKRKK